MSRKERSDLYGDMIELLEQLYNVVVDPDAPESAKWSVLVVVHIAIPTARQI